MGPFLGFLFYFIDLTPCHCTKRDIIQYIKKISRSYNPENQITLLRMENIAKQKIFNWGNAPKEMSNILSHQGISNQNNPEILHHISIMVRIMTPNDIIYWHDCRERGRLLTWWYNHSDNQVGVSSENRV